MFKTIKVFLMSIAVSVFLGVLATDCRAQQVLKLGFLAPLTGDISRYGKDELNAARLAVEEINQRKLIPGMTLEISAQDGRCNGKDAATAAKWLVEAEKVPIILGGVCSGETLAAARVTDPARVILYTVFSSHPDVSKAGDFVFRACVNDRDGALMAARVILKKGYRRVGVISEISDYALMFGDVFKKAIQDSGKAEIVAAEEYNPAESDFRQTLLRIKQKTPDVLLLNPQGGAKGGLILKQLRALGFKVPLIGTFAFSAPEAVEVAGGPDALEGLEFVDAQGVESEEGRSFMEKFTKRFPALQSEFEVVLRYESVFILAQAISQVGANTEKIKEFLYAMPPYKGIEYSYRFDRNGDAVGLPYVLKKFRSGKIITLSSSDEPF